MATSIETVMVWVNLAIHCDQSPANLHSLATALTTVDVSRVCRETDITRVFFFTAQFKAIPVRKGKQLPASIPPEFYALFLAVVSYFSKLAISTGYLDKPAGQAKVDYWCWHLTAALSKLPLASPKMKGLNIPGSTSIATIDAWRRERGLGPLEVSGQHRLRLT